MFVHLCEHVIDHFYYFLVGGVKSFLVGLQKLVDISHTGCKGLVNFFLGVVLHFGELFDAGGPGGDDVFDFSWFLAVLVQLHVAGNALGAEGLDAVGGLADVGDGVLLVRGAGDRDEPRGRGAVHGGHLTPPATGCHF